MPTPLPTMKELGGCIFGKPNKPQGYASRQYKGKQIGAHRAVWLEAYGEIPEGMVVNHLCHSVAAKKGMCLGGERCIHRSCYNLNHLELVTHEENVKQGSSKLRNKPYCSNGHKITEDNIISRKSVTKGKTTIADLCKTCYEINAKNSNARAKARKEARADSDI